MGIQTEFNPDLALRNINEFKEGKRLKEECIPENIINGQIYEFLKKGQRLFWLSEDEKWNKGELPLYETKGQGKFSRPLA